MKCRVRSSMRVAALSMNTCSSTVVLLNEANRFSDNLYFVMPLLTSSILSTWSDSNSDIVASRFTQASVEISWPISPTYSSINFVIGESVDELFPLFPIGTSCSSPSTIVSKPAACIVGLGLAIVSVSTVDSRDGWIAVLVAEGNAVTVTFEVVGLEVDAVRLKEERGEEGFADAGIEVDRDDLF